MATNTTSALDFEKFFVESRITHKTIIPPLVPAITIGGAIFVCQGEVGIIAGPPKSGKSSVATNIMSTALGASESLDTLQIRCLPANGKPIAFIDTEQHPHYTNALRKRVCRDAELANNQEPDNFYLLNVMPLLPKQRRAFVLHLLDVKLPGMHLCIIDGLADLVSDPNDTDESFSLFDELINRARVHQTAIVCMIHDNPNSTKMRGNLGSQGERKAAGVIAVSKDRAKGIHSIETRLLRGSGDRDKIWFHYSPEASRFVQVDPGRIAHLKVLDGRKALDLVGMNNLAKACLEGGSLNYKRLVAALMSKGMTVIGENISESTAKRRINQMVEAGVLAKNEGNAYELAEEQLQPADVVEDDVPF